ncbi:MAG: hypothetical protein U0694_04370 [Anaerolineae bacterium]
MLRISTLWLLLACLLRIAALPAQGRPTPPPALLPLIDGCEGVASACLYGLGLDPVSGYLELLDPLLLEHGYTLAEEGTTGDYDMTGIEELYHIYVPSAESGLCTLEVYYSAGDFHIVWVNMSACGTLILEDVVTHFGIPNSVWLSREGGSLWFGATGIQVFFSAELRRNTLVSNIVVLPPWEGGPYLDWHGYAPLWLYCVLEPYYENCEVG